MFREFHQFLLCQLHQRRNLLLRTFEVLDRKRVRRNAFDVESQADFQHLHSINITIFNVIPKTYPPQRDEAVTVSFLDSLVVQACVPPVPIHNKGDMFGYWSGCEDFEEEVAGFAGDFVLQPIPATSK